MSVARPLALAAVLCAALPGVAAAQADDPVAALRAAFAGAGCVMTRDNQYAVLDASGLTEDAAVDALSVLMGAGETVAEGETVRLTSGPCAGVGGPVPDPTQAAQRRAQVSAALAARGCRVSERESAAFAREAGMDDTTATATLFELIGRGEARIDRSGAVEVVELTVPPCNSGAAPPRLTKP